MSLATIINLFAAPQIHETLEVTTRTVYTAPSGAEYECDVLEVDDSDDSAQIEYELRGYVVTGWVAQSQLTLEVVGG